MKTSLALTALLPLPPNSVMAAVLLVSELLSLPPALLLATCSVESDFRSPTSLIRSKDGAHGPSVGVCQMKPSTASMMLSRGTSFTDTSSAPTVKDLLNPYTNVLYAGLYLKWQMGRYDGNMCHAISAYNLGRAKYSEINNIYRNRSYLTKTLNRMDMYEKLTPLACNKTPIGIGRKRLGQDKGDGPFVVGRLAVRCSS